MSFWPILCGWSTRDWRWLVWTLWRQGGQYAMSELPHFSEIQYFIWLRIARYRGLLDGLGNIWIQERSSPSTFLLSLPPSTLLSYKISLSTIHAPKCTCSINTVTTLTPNNPHNQVRSGCRRELPHSGTAPKLPSCSSPTLPSSSPCKASTSTFWEGCQGVVSALLKCPV